MIKKLLFILITIACCKNSSAQNSVKIIEEYINSYNKKDSLNLNKLVDQNYKGYWENQIIISNKEELFANFSIDKALNSFETIKITQNSKDSIVIINTYTTDYFKALNLEPFISEKIFYLKSGKIIKTVERIPEEYKEYDESRTDPIDFKLWLRENYCMSPGQFYQNGREASFLKKIVEAYRDKVPKIELEKIISDYKSYNFKKFIREPNELSLQEFIYKAITLLKEKKYDEYLNLYVTQEEFIDCFKFYGYGTDYAIQEFKENVFIPDLEWFKFNSEKRFFDCYMNYTVMENIDPKVTKFGEILRSTKTVKSNEGYYFCHAMFKIKAFGYDYQEGYEVERDIISDLNFGEVIYLPEKGWKLMDKLR